MYLLWLPLLPFLLRYFPNLLTSRFKFSLSLDLAASSSVSSLFLELAFKAMIFNLFSLDSNSISLCISISCSLSLPNSAVVVMMDKSIDLDMAVTFGCQFLSRNFSTLMFSSSLSNSLPKPMRWLTMWVNLFWTSAMDSPFCILKGFGCQFLLRHFSTLMFSSSLWNSLPRPMWLLTMWVNLFWTSVMDSSFCILKGFGCQFLSRHFSTLMFSYSLANSLPRPMRWLTMWVNLFWTSTMDSLFCILKGMIPCSFHFIRPLMSLQ